MCYDLSANLKNQLKVARRRNDPTAVAEILEEMERRGESEFYHISGFAHPTLLIYTKEAHDMPIFSQWGLIPSWTKSKLDAEKFWNNTLNARGETIFEKASFRDSAKHKRCLIYVDGFFEHHHHGGVSYPFHIKRKDGEMICLGGLWSEWSDKETGEIRNTFTIVTTTGNSALASIHNNPKLDGPRMPLILHEEIEDEWLFLDSADENDLSRLHEIIRPYPEEEFDYFSVPTLRGKNAVGNSEKAISRMVYPELWLLESELANSL